MKIIVKRLEKEQGALSFVDILLNHTSYDSEWLLDLPDAVYNQHNTPQLAAAIQLDRAIQEFSDQIALGECSEYNRKIIRNESDLNQIMELMRVKVFQIQEQEIEKYFQFNVEEIVEKFKNSLTLKGFPIILKEMDIDDDENFFSKSGYHVLSDHIKVHTSNLG